MVDSSVNGCDCFIRYKLLIFKSSGSFAFYYPEKDLFLVGDVNQIANPALPVRMAMRVAMAL